MLQDPEHPRPARSVPVGRREPALVGMAATLTRRLGVYRRHLFISIFGDVAMSEFELWVKKRRAAAPARTVCTHASYDGAAYGYPTYDP